MHGKKLWNWHDKRDWKRKKKRKLRVNERLIKEEEVKQNGMERNKRGRKKQGTKLGEWEVILPAAMISIWINNGIKRRKKIVCNVHKK